MYLVSFILTEIRGISRANDVEKGPLIDTSCLGYKRLASNVINHSSYTSVSDVEPTEKEDVLFESCLHLFGDCRIARLWPSQCCGSR